MKKLRLFLMITLGCAILAGCSSNKLSGDFNEEELKTTTEKVIQMLCNEEYDKIKEMSGQELIDAGVTDKIKEVWEPMAKDLGKFDSIDKEAVVGNGDQATVVIISKFENGNAQFTISYNKDMKLTGFYIK
ncbi:DUF3887 domain-containing protein [Terrisporobacter mayombei]|uniref:DUF3887 domain-containing protein n=1 Tax=Terrisporobacter mayombei TaxID=1541 RepID=A0ABY9Q3V1_9FIRM|nr:DUF3887 domain-containing protein [Terrisporobacter mayombei]MCC3867653.1 DUF3887 domain-containing protein [Terrisporobacter mayombei]WMT81915.1 hypothetical protein TEMA_22630 [Terrisporobacter mayombei]